MQGGRGAALLQPCVGFVGKIKLWNVHQSGFFHVANGKKPNPHCWSTERNVWARVTASSGACLLHLGLGLGAQQGHLNSLRLPLPLSSAPLYTGLLCRQACCLGVSQQLSGKHFYQLCHTGRKRALLCHRNSRIDLNWPHSGLGRWFSAAAQACL